MGRKFSELAAEVAETWDEDTRSLYESASKYFAFESAAQVRLGRELAAIREGRKLTQVALAAISGVDQSEISRIERGTSNPTRDTLIRLGGALKLQLAFVPEEAVQTSRGDSYYVKNSRPDLFV